MRAGFDARFACARYDGVGRYVAALLGELAVIDGGPELFAAWPAGGGDRYRLPEPGRRLHALRLPRGAAPESPWAQLELPGLQRRHRLDLWHAPFPVAPLLGRVPLVVTLHDCIPERYPEYFSRVDRTLYRISTWTALRRARLVITPSQLSADEAARYYRIPQERLRVVPNGVDSAVARQPQRERRIRGRLGLPDGYVLLVGRPRPHKHHAIVIRALARIPPDTRPQLVRVGAPDPRLPDGSTELAARLGVALHHLESLDEHELTAVYRGAALVALPSRVEGFGFPMLEALAAGVPVLASDIEPLRASGGTVARYVEAEDTAWVEAIEAMLDDRSWQRRVMSEGPAQAALFPWSRSASATLGVWREVAA